MCGDIYIYMYINVPIDTYTLRKNTVLDIISKPVGNASRPKIFCVSMCEMERGGLTIFIRALTGA